MNFVKLNVPSHPALQALRQQINDEAIIAKVPPCLLAAIVWRETDGKNILQYGADPNTGILPDGTTAGVGLTQITSGVDWSNPKDPTIHGYHLLKESDNLYVSAAYYLAPLMASAARAQRDNPSEFNVSCHGQQVYAIGAGYNGGWGTVQAAMANGTDADSNTTDGYATDLQAKFDSLVSESLANP